MDFQLAIEQIFEGQAFARPLFYGIPGGLRFELSESGSAIEQFLMAMDKARVICATIFDSSDSLVVCLRCWAQASPFAYRNTLAALRAADIVIPAERMIWIETVPESDWLDEGVDERWLHLAFHAPVSLLPNLLWCAFAQDFSIQPNPHCAVYLFNFERRVMVLPYDDRGMDVVGPNHAFLASIFRQHRQFLLDYDLPTMLATFESGDS